MDNKPLYNFYANDFETCLTPNHFLFGRLLSVYNNESSALPTEPHIITSKKIEQHKLITFGNDAEDNLQFKRAANNSIA